jgi:hypothetical protein
MLCNSPVAGAYLFQNDSLGSSLPVGCQLLFSGSLTSPALSPLPKGGVQSFPSPIKLPPLPTNGSRNPPGRLLRFGLKSLCHAHHVNAVHIPTSIDTVKQSQCLLYCLQAQSLLCITNHASHTNNGSFRIQSKKR